MPLTALVTVVLRMYSLVWFLAGLGMFVSSYQSASNYSPHGGSWMVYLGPALEWAIAIALFFLSQPIARIVTPPPNPEVQLGGLTQHDLYCFAFTFLGLYFFLSSIGDTLNWLHYFLLVARDTQDFEPKRRDAFYTLSRPLITLVIGAATILFSSRLARKLIAFQRKSE